MSRSCGDEVVDDAAADRDRAVRDLLEPGDHAQRRRLAAARRADEDEELAVRDVEREVLDGLDAAVVDLVDVLELHLSHVAPSFVVTRVSRCGTPGRRSGSTASLAVDAKRPRRTSVSSSRAPSAASGRRTGSCARARARQSSRSSRRLAQVSDRVRGDVRVADAAARERADAAAQRDQLAVAVEQPASHVSGRPRHRPPRVLAPLALEPDLVAGEDHRHAGRRHLQPDADELPLAGAGDRRRSAPCRGCRAAPTSGATAATGRRRGTRASCATSPAREAAARRPGSPRSCSRSSAGSSSPRSHAHAGRMKPA